MNKFIRRILVCFVMAAICKFFIVDFWAYLLIATISGFIVGELIDIYGDELL